MKASEIQDPIQLGYPVLMHGSLVWAVKRNIRVGYIKEQDLEKARILHPGQSKLAQGAAFHLFWRIVRVLKHDPISDWYVVAFDGPAIRLWLFKEHCRRTAKGLAAHLQRLSRLFGYRHKRKRAQPYAPIVREESKAKTAEDTHVCSDFTRDELRNIWERAEVYFLFYFKSGSNEQDKGRLYDSLFVAAHNLDVIKSVMEKGESS